MDRPIISDFVRAGNTGSCVVSGVADDGLVYCKGLNGWDIMRETHRVEVGSRVGNGAMDLDFSAFVLGLPPYPPLPAPLFFQSDNETRDEWSPVADFHGTRFLDLASGITLDEGV